MVTNSNVIERQSPFEGHRTTYYRNTEGGQQMMTPTELVKHCAENNTSFDGKCVEHCSEWFLSEQETIDIEKSGVDEFAKNVPSEDRKGVDDIFNEKQQALFQEYKDARDALMASGDDVRGYLGSRPLVDYECGTRMLDNGMPKELLQPDVPGKAVSGPSVQHSGADVRKAASLQGQAVRSQPGRELPSFDEICPGADSGKQSSFDGYGRY